MVVKFFTFAKFHNKKQVGSTTIRVDNLLTMWDEASLYRFGDDAQVLIFQKIYNGQDYKLPTDYDGIKILDICDPDWFDNAYIKETVDGMDAVVVPTKPMQEFIQQLTDKPVRIIKDRFIIDSFPKPKPHKGKIKTAVWFGYKQNAELMKFVVPTLERENIHLICISNQDPMMQRWGSNYDEYTYVPFDQETLFKTLQQADVAVLPKGNRPQDIFKSENKTVQAQLCGLPVITNAEELNKYQSAAERNKFVETEYAKIQKEYDVSNSVKEYKELIEELRQSRA